MLWRLAGIPAFIRRNSPYKQRCLDTLMILARHSLASDKSRRQFLVNLGGSGLVAGPHKKAIARATNCWAREI